jgi:hypothetical protein
MDRNNYGSLTAEELEELRVFARECEEMTIHNAKFLAEQYQSRPA